MNIRRIDGERSLHRSGVKVEWYEEVSSTMTLARCLAERLSGSEIGLVLADRQTAGRGRQGRGWETPHRGFLGTFVIRSHHPAGFFTGFSLAVGYSVLQACESFGCELTLKWPNDILALDGKKLSGVLIELLPETSGTIVLIGVGVNLIGAPEGGAALLDLSGGTIDVLAFTERLLASFRCMWEEFGTQGFPVFRDRWLSRASRLDRPLRIRNGEGVVTGKFTDIRPNGALVLESAGETVEIHAGEVLL